MNSKMRTEDFSSFTFRQIAQVIHEPEMYLGDGLFKFPIRCNFLKNIRIQFSKFVLIFNRMIKKYIL